FGAEEGTSLKRAEIAIGKANAALAMGIGTRSINKMAKDRPYFIGSVTSAVGGSFIPVPGGVLVKDDSGAIIGAVGISGDVSDNDEAAAIAGITAAGLKADPGKD
ncbi:MAG TPA: heme-binding protein, partial [Alphaproteobacteria bacterium]|nr:heme-binding protein [Alphaproteobacteria bacterium]